jgi:RimJ/RimL family protein N-acetyltransferase
MGPCAPFLEGERIYLRPLESEDADSFYAWFNDNRIMKSIGEVYPISSEEAKNRVEQWMKAPDSVSLGIILKEDNRLIGTVGLISIDHVHRRAKLGIIIGEEEFRSKGYGTEAITLILGYGFDQLNLNMVYLGVIAFNKKAITCYETIGFSHDGIIREKFHMDGTFYDCILMSLLRREWTENEH